MHSFEATIQEGKRGGAFVVVPLDVEAVFGKKRVKIKATLDGIPYRGSMVRMGSPDHIIGIIKEIRQKAGKDIGDKIAVCFEEDLEPRVVTVPEDFQKMLDAAPLASKYYQSLSYTHQKEYVQWIEEAKREETRMRRLQKAISMLREGKKER